MATHRLLVYPVLAVTCSALAPRVAVFGGSSCRLARVRGAPAAGCRVVSVSRGGAALGLGPPWAAGIEWIAADMLDDAAAPGSVASAAVSCVSNVRPAGWAQFWGLHWTMARRRENGYVNGRRRRPRGRRGGRARQRLGRVQLGRRRARGCIDGKIAAENAGRARFGRTTPSSSARASSTAGGSRRRARSRPRRSARRRCPYFAVNARRGLSAAARSRSAASRASSSRRPRPSRPSRPPSPRARSRDRRDRVGGTDEIEALARGAAEPRSRPPSRPRPKRAGRRAVARRPAGAAAARRRALPDAPFEGALRRATPCTPPGARLLRGHVDALSE